MNISELREWVKENYPGGSAVAEIVFGGDAENSRKLFKSDKAVLKYMSRLIVLWFHYIYFSYRKRLDTLSGEERERVLAAMDRSRVLRGFEKLHIYRPVTYELIEDIMQDVQVAINTGGRQEVDLGASEAVIEYGTLAYYARKAREGVRLNLPEEYNLQRLANEFSRILNGCSALSGLKTVVRKVEAEFFLDGKRDERKEIEYVDFKKFPFELPAKDCLIRYDNEGSVDYYYLSGVEFIMKDGKFVVAAPGRGIDGNALKGIKADYYSFDGTEMISVVIGRDETLKERNFGYRVFFRQDDPQGYFGALLTQEMLAAIGSSEGGEGGDYSVYAINYKYISNLARAVADVLESSNDMQEAIRSGYKVKFPYLFGEERGLSWDVIVAIIMVQDGAGKLLEKLFVKSNDVFEMLVSNLKTRLGSNFSCDTNDETRVAERLRRDRRLGEPETLWRDRRAQFRARKLIDSLNRAAYGNEDGQADKLSFPLSIRSRLKWLEDLQDSMQPDEEKLKTVKGIVVETLATLIAFYESLFYYMKEKDRFESESRYCVMKEKEVAEKQKKAQGAFDESFQSRREELCALQGAEILEKLDELCLDYASGHECYALMRRKLGKTQFIDNAFLRKKLSACLDAPKEVNAYRIFGDVRAALIYLQSGLSGEEAETAALDSRAKIGLDAIFPYVMTYQYDKQTGDGYHVNNFSVISLGGTDFNVMILSEFKYELNEKYYCLPNIQSSVRGADMELWVEPIVIKCPLEKSDEDGNKTS